jgi:HemY protein
MKFSIIVLLATLVFAFAAHFLLEDPGYVAINFRGYLVEMSVPVLLGLFVALVFAVWAIRKLVVAPRLIGEAAGRYRSGRAGEKLTRGMIEVAEGNFARGEKLLARAASTSDAPLFNYLQAARAAHLQGSDQRRDEWLRLAYEHTPAAANAVLLTQAELQLDRGQYEQALATLRRIDEDSRDHSYALALLGRLYFRLGDWDQLAEILPRLKKHGRVTQEKIDVWSIRVHREMLGRAADSDAVASTWKQVPKNLRTNLDILDAYFSALIRSKGRIGQSS